MTKFIEHWRTFAPHDKIKIVLSLLAICLSAIAVTYLAAKTNNEKPKHKGFYYEVLIKENSTYYSIERDCKISMDNNLTSHEDDVKFDTMKKKCDF